MSGPLASWELGGAPDAPFPRVRFLGRRDSEPASCRVPTVQIRQPSAHASPSRLRRQNSARVPQPSAPPSAVGSTRQLGGTPRPGPQLPSRDPPGGLACRASLSAPLFQAPASPGITLRPAGRGVMLQPHARPPRPPPGPVPPRGRGCRWLRGERLPLTACRPGSRGPLQALPAP